MKGFDVKITFNKPKKEIFITDFRRYSFLLNNMYIPKNLLDKERFDKKLQKLNITKEELKALSRPDKYESHRMDKDYLNICNEIKKVLICVSQKKAIFYKDVSGVLN